MSPQGTIGFVSTVTTWVTNTFDQFSHFRRETAIWCKGCGRVSWTGGGVSTEGVQHSWFIEEGVSGRVVLGEVVMGMCGCHQTTEWGEGLSPSEEVRVLNPVQKS